MCATVCVDVGNAVLLRACGACCSAVPRLRGKTSRCVTSCNFWGEVRRGMIVACGTFREDFENASAFVWWRISGNFSFLFVVFVPLCQRGAMVCNAVMPGLLRMLLPQHA